METVLLITTIYALIGAYFVSIGRPEGFAIWIYTNIVFAFNNYAIGQYEQAALFSCYLLLAINGLRNTLKTS